MARLLNYKMADVHGTELNQFRAAKLIMWNFLSLSPVPITRTSYHHHLRMVTLSTLFRTNNRRVYANVIPTQSSFWRWQSLISGPCDQHLSDSHQKPSGSHKTHALLQTNKRSIKFPTFREMLQHCWRSCMQHHFWKLTEIP